MDILEDNRLFRKLKLTTDCSFLLSIDRQTFRECFEDNVSDEVNYFGVSGHNKNFHGQIRNKTFDLYRPTKLINNTSFAGIKGMYEDCDSKLKVSFVTYIPMTLVLIIYLMLLLMTIILNVLTINSENTPAILIIIFNAFYLFFGIRMYYYLKKAVTTLQNDVEREMGYWMAKVNALQQHVSSMVP
jgi:hypothetical protein